MPKNGCFSASGASRLCASGSGATRNSYIYEIGLDVVGDKKDITTRAMLHGINNEAQALDMLVSIKGGEHNFDFTQGKQLFYPIDDTIGATPDAFKKGEWVGDAKCQYSIYAFIQQNRSVKRAYYYQMQTQMIAMRVDTAYLANYLTKPEQFGQDDWQEYPFPIDDRIFIHEIKRDEQVCDEIMTNAHNYYHLIGEVVQQLQSAIDLSEEEFFKQQMYDDAIFYELKTRWLNNDRQVYKVNNEYYVMR